MVDVEQDIVDLYDRDLLAEYSINQITRKLGRKGYGFVYDKISSMLDRGVLKKRVVGTSSLCSLNFDEYGTVLLLCRNEDLKAKRMYSRRKLLKGVLEQLVEDSKKHNTVHAVVVFGSYAKGTAGEKSDVDLLVVVEDRKKESVSRVANTLSMSHSVELNAVVMDKAAFQGMLRDKGVNVVKEAFKYHVVFYGCEKFFEYIREVKDDIKV